MPDISTYRSSGGFCWRGCGTTCWCTAHVFHPNRFAQSTNTNVERALRFVATFAAQAPDREDDTSSVFIQDLVADLVLLSAAANKVVRVRACGLLASIMQQLTTDMQDEALDELQEAMLKRLKDKV